MCAQPLRDSESPGPALAVITGMFDPPTLGHLDVIGRSAELFPKVVVGVGNNPEKRPMLSLKERAALLQACVAELGNVEVRTYTGLTAEFLRQLKAKVVVRGVRNCSDFHYELVMAETNRSLLPGLETVLLPAAPQFRHLSSALVRQIAPHVDLNTLAQFVPEPVARALAGKLRKGS